ncbi:MAG: zinc ribbon domain-containing protein [Methanobacteriaceae archaeon]|nr:zinc ribbon domain-containing protein [Methanobacteriaceae archaeon]
MICPKCRHENPDDALICEFCGEALNLQKQAKLPDNGDSDNNGGLTVGNVKFIILGIVILFIITFALLWPERTASIADNDSYISGHAAWKQIAIYNGTSDDLRSFQIKGDKMRVYISAKPLTPDTNLKCQIFGPDTPGSSDDLAWKGEDMSLKTMSLQMKTRPGTYSVNIDIPDIPVNQVQWTVQVFDYF